MPCPGALAMARLPHQTWTHRAEVYLLLEKARQQLEAQPEATSLAHWARVATLSPGHFHRLFRATYGVTPHRYGRRCRLARAHLLISREMSVSAAALEAGYESRSAFVRAYHAEWGHAPRLAKARPNRKIGHES